MKKSFGSPANITNQSSNKKQFNSSFNIKLPNSPMNLNLSLNCENMTNVKEYISLFDLNELSNDIDQIVQTHKNYIESNLKYGSKVGCLNKRNYMSKNTINENIASVLATIDISLKSNDDINNITNDLKNIETNKFNDETNKICNIFDAYDKNINRNARPYLINAFFDKSYQEMSQITYLKNRTIDLSNHFDKNENTNILFDVIGSYLNMTCNKNKLKSLIDNLIYNNKKIYIIDFMNLCHVVKLKKYPNENTENLIFNFVINKIFNGDVVIIIFKSGCVEKQTMINYIQQTDILFSNLNDRFHIISMENRGNIDDFIFWIFSTYFYNVLNYYNKLENLIIMTGDKQNLENENSDIVSINAKNLISFEKGYLTELLHNPHEIKYFDKKYENNKKKIIIESIDNKTLIYFNTFDNLMTIRDVDLLTTYQLSKKILGSHSYLNNYSDGLLGVFLAEPNYIQLNFVKYLVNNFVPVGLVFYTFIKYIQLNMYKYNVNNMYNYSIQNDRHNYAFTKDELFNIVINM